MIVYLITFVIISFLVFLIERCNNKKINIFFVILIIFTLSFVGGIRDYTIGTDVNVYGKPWFEVAVASDTFADYVEKIQTSDVGYLLFNYFISRFTSNVNIFLFLHQVVCNTLVIHTLYKYKKENKNFSLILAISMYYFIYYFRTYNFLRQAMSLSILFFASKYLFKKEYVKYLFWILISAQFHFTGYFAILLLIFHMLITSKIKRKKMFIFIVVVIAIILCFNVINVMKLLHNIGILNDRLYAYSIFYLKEKADINFIESIYKMIFIFTVAIWIKNNKNSESKLTLFLFAILDFISFQLSSVMYYTDRIALFFGYTRMLLVPDILDKNNYKNRFIFEILLISILFSFWMYKFIISGSCEVYPYTIYSKF